MLGKEWKGPAILCGFVVPAPGHGMRIACSKTLDGMMRTPRGFLTPPLDFKSHIITMIAHGDDYRCKQ
jgi:hypothetical protein